MPLLSAESTDKVSLRGSKLGGDTMSTGFDSCRSNSVALAVPGLRRSGTPSMLQAASLLAELGGAINVAPDGARGLAPGLGPGCAESGFMPSMFWSICTAA